MLIFDAMLDAIIDATMMPMMLMRILCDDDAMHLMR
jgi:hypothetical protein